MRNFYRMVFKSQRVFSISHQLLIMGIRKRSSVTTQMIVIQYRFQVSFFFSWLFFILRKEEFKTVLVLIQFVLEYSFVRRKRFTCKKRRILMLFAPFNVNFQVNGWDSWPMCAVPLLEQAEIVIYALRYCSLTKAL